MPHGDPDIPTPIIINPTGPTAPLFKTARTPGVTTLDILNLVILIDPLFKGSMNLFIKGSAMSDPNFTPIISLFKGRNICKEGSETTGLGVIPHILCTLINPGEMIGVRGMIRHR